MLARTISTLILWTLILVLVTFKIIGGAFLLIAVTGLLAQWEFYKLQECKGLKVFKKAGLACGALLFLFSYLQNIACRSPYTTWMHLEIFLILIVILGALTRQIFEKEQSSAVVTIALTLLGFFYIPFLFNFVIKILFIEGAPHSGLQLIVYFIAVTKMTDVGALLTGRVLGKHQMSPRISPKKTWEGFAGGILAAIGSSIALVLLMPESLGLVIGGYYHPLILGVCLGLISVIGDLGESVIKRDAHIKDSGHIIPGIGGVLDLIDSLLFTAPFFYCYLILFVIP